MVTPAWRAIAAVGVGAPVADDDDFHLARVEAFQEGAQAPGDDPLLVVGGNDHRYLGSSAHGAGEFDGARPGLAPAAPTAIHRSKPPGCARRRARSIRVEPGPGQRGAQCHPGGHEPSPCDRSPPGPVLVDEGDLAGQHQWALPPGRSTGGPDVMGHDRVGSDHRAVPKRRARRARSASSPYMKKRSSNPPSRPKPGSQQEAARDHAHFAHRVAFPTAHRFRVEHPGPAKHGRETGRKAEQAPQ